MHDVEGVLGQAWHLLERQGQPRITWAKMARLRFRVLGWPQRCHGLVGVRAPAAGRRQTLERRWLATSTPWTLAVDVVK